MKVYIVVELKDFSGFGSYRDCINLIGVYADKKTAEKIAYSCKYTWCNVIEKEVTK